MVWPNGLCFANQMFGGPSKTCEYLSDSSCDWGQGLPELLVYGADAGQGRRLTIREPGDARHEAGSSVSLDLAREFCHLFRRTGEALPRPIGATSPAPASPDLTTSAA